MPDTKDYYLNLNLSYLKPLKERILNTKIVSDFKFVGADNGMPVLLINGQYANNKENPKIECQNLFAKFDANIKADSDATIIIIGIEAGYTLKYACENYKNDIILFESSLETLKYVFETGNFIKYLAQQRFSLVVDADLLKEKVSELKKYYIVCNEYYSKKYSKIIV